MDTQYLEREHGRIAYDDRGEGPLVICVPSMGDVREEFRFLAPQLATAGYRVVSMDVRGHGETSENWPDYSVGAIGSDILALIQSLKAGPAILIGTSMAAGAAVWAAAEAPDLVAGLVLIGPFVRGGGDLPGKLFAYALFARPWGPSLWLRYFSTLYPTQKPADFPQYTANLLANLKEPGRMEALQHMLAASKAASEERLPKVTAPVLVIMGSKDPDFKDPETEAQRVRQSLKQSLKCTTIMVKDAGHYPQAEMPEVTAQIILPFIQKVGKVEAIKNVA